MNINHEYFSKSNFIEIPKKFDKTFKKENPSPMFRKTFFIKATPKKAILKVCALGYGCIYLNGATAISDLFISPVSNYDKTLWYTEYEITNKIKTGKNVFGVMLGNGFYNESFKSAWDFDKADWRDNLKLLLVLELEYDNHKEFVYSNEKWKCDYENSYVRYNELRSGEIHDFRYQINWMDENFDDSLWKNAVKSKIIPKGNLKKCSCQPIKERKEYLPINCFQNMNGNWILDFGQNMSGYLRAEIKQLKDDKIKIEYAEMLTKDLTRDMSGIHSGYYKESDYETDYLICSGKTDYWCPLFVYHGFRYVIIYGLKDKPDINKFKAVFVCQDVMDKSSFDCSSNIINKIRNMCRMSSLSNMFYMITDCPTREKLGWCNDARASVEQMIENFDIVPLYNKWIQDIYDAMNDDGKLPGIIPTAGWGYNWGNGPLSDGILFEIPFKIYRYYNNDSLIKKSLPYFKKYLDYAETKKDDDGLVGYGLKDWAGPFEDEVPTPLKLSDSLLLIEFCRIAEISAELNNDNTLFNDFKTRENNYKKAVMNKYYDSSSHQCLANTQTAVAMMIVDGIYENLFPLKNQLKNLIEENNYHHYCGMLGMQYLYKALSICDLDEYSYKIITSKERPSYCEWIDNSATTMWETWNKSNSKNHHMYSGVSSWFNETIAGLNLNQTLNGYQEAIIKPVFLSDIKFCDASYNTVAGVFKIKWKRTDENIKLNIEIPYNITANLQLNNYCLKESKLKIYNLCQGTHKFELIKC